VVERRSEAPQRDLAPFLEPDTPGVLENKAQVCLFYSVLVFLFFSTLQNSRGHCEEHAFRSIKYLPNDFFKLTTNLKKRKILPTSWSMLTGNAIIFKILVCREAKLALSKQLWLNS
jgi:hypothetical protein